MEKFDHKEINKQINAALKIETELSEDICWEIAFHMTDWLDDIEKLLEFFLAPNHFDSKTITSRLIGFLVHAPEHVGEAAKLLIGFGIEGIFQDNSSDKGKNFE